MEIAVLADIHSNYVALEACLSYAKERGIDTFFFLGDYLGELAYPQRTMALIYETAEKCKCYFVRGNKEDYWISGNQSQFADQRKWQDRNSTTGMLLYACETLTEKDMDFFGKLEPAIQVGLAGMPPLTVCHGSPRKNNEKLLPGDSRTYEIMDSTNTDVILCGHTHVQGKIVHNGKTVLNPGSVGIPFLSDGRAQFMLLHGRDGQWLEEFVSLDYDRERVLKEMQEEKLYEHAFYWSLITEKIIRGEKITHGSILSRAMELCRLEMGSCNWPEVPEKYYELALQEWERRS